MPDPFEHLRLDDSPVDPDPIFAARLRERVARALTPTQGGTMSDLAVREPAVLTTNASVSPYLIVRGAESALAWYADALGARVVGDPIVMGDGTVGHAELDLGGARLMLAEESAGIGVAAPDPDAGVPVTIHVSVPDVDTLFERALAAGARMERPLTDHQYGRGGVVRDPYGHRWMLMREAPTGPRHGDIGYVSLWVPDVTRATEFFAHVLGWSYGPASGPQGRQVQGQSLHHGVWERASDPTLFCCYAVDSIDAAGERIRAAGGTANEPTEEPYGLLADCTDDQGVAFAIFEPPGGTVSGAAAAPNGSRHGDLAYVTMEVADSARTRAFYGSVLGWRFEPGRVEDGWNVDDVVPMVGVAGGRDPVVIPMYRVDDVAVAVERVREAGGAATDPEAQPYGISSTCTDDQGTRFYLGQL
ncbi:MAG: VOC family protein [Acidimicrobiales bacterium]